MVCCQRWSFGLLDYRFSVSSEYFRPVSCLPIVQLVFLTAMAGCYQLYVVLLWPTTYALLSSHDIWEFFGLLIIGLWCILSWRGEWFLWSRFCVFSGGWNWFSLQWPTCLWNAKTLLPDLSMYCCENSTREWKSQTICYKWSKLRSWLIEFGKAFITIKSLDGLVWFIWAESWGHVMFFAIPVVFFFSLF